MKEKEIWRDIAGYEGKYQVSNLGNIKNLNYRRTGKERPLKPIVKVDGRLKVDLYKNGKQKEYLVHKLVANAFIPDKTNFKYVDEKDKLKYIDNLDNLEINHKDEHPKNNNVNNLEWCTRKYNNTYGTRCERAGKMIAKANKNHPNKSKKVLQYDLNGNLIKEWPSTREIERQLGFDSSHIAGCCRGERKTAYGFIWRYKE